MRTVKAGSEEYIKLWHQGEKNVTQVEFDLASFIAEHGEGVPQLTVKRPHDLVEYAAPLKREGDKAYWTVGPEWLENEGRGYCQLSWHIGTDIVAKSDAYKTYVQGALGADVGAVPEPQASYLAQIQTAGATALVAAKQTEENLAEVKRLTVQAEDSYAQMIKSLSFDRESGRWVVARMDGSVAYVPGYDPSNFSVWSFYRDDFAKYPIGTNSFAQNLGVDWEIHPSYMWRASYDIVGDENKYLQLCTSANTSRAMVILKNRVQGEATIQFDYMPTLEGAVEPGVTATDFMDIWIIDSDVRLRINYFGRSLIYSMMKPQTEYSPYIRGKSTEHYQFKPGEWYRVKVRVHPGVIIAKVWNIKTEQEPGDDAVYGVTTMKDPAFSEELLSKERRVSISLGPMNRPPDSDWKAGIDNFCVYRDLADSVAVKLQK